MAEHVVTRLPYDYQEEGMPGHQETELTDDYIEQLFSGGVLLEEDLSAIRTIAQEVEGCFN